MWALYPDKLSQLKKYKIRHPDQSKNSTEVQSVYKPEKLLFSSLARFPLVNSKQLTMQRKWEG